VWLVSPHVISAARHLRLLWYIRSEVIMKNQKLKFAATILAFIIGIVSVRVSGLFSSLTLSNTQQDFPAQVDLLLAEKTFAEQNFDNVEVHSDQLLNNEEESEVFSPSGDYHPLNRPADESEKFIQFDLQVRGKKGKLVAWGEVRGVQSWYKFTSVSVTEKYLKFSTAKVSGVSYNFEGEFLKKGYGVTLEGTLRKFVNGKKVMEVHTPFVHYAGC
jgi:hypothetical protein